MSAAARCVLVVATLTAGCRTHETSRPHRDAAGDFLLARDAPSSPPLDAPRPIETTDASTRDTSWQSLATGVSVRDLASAHGAALFVALAGWRINDDSTRAWVDALAYARLAALGVARVYAVRGPAAVDNRTHDLGITQLADDLVAHAASTRDPVVVVAHSSGELVATELFHRLFVADAARGESLRARILFVSLDGDADLPSDPTRSLSSATVSPLRHAWFVTARDALRGTPALSNATMRQNHQRFPANTDFLEYDARDAGCTAVMCVHLSLVNRHPLARGNASYASFGAEGPNTFWLDAAIARATAP